MPDSHPERTFREGRGASARLCSLSPWAPTEAPGLEVLQADRPDSNQGPFSMKKGLASTSRKPRFEPSRGRRKQRDSPQTGDQPVLEHFTCLLNREHKLPMCRTFRSRRPGSNRGPLHYELCAAVTASHRESPLATRRDESAGLEMTHDDLRRQPRRPLVNLEKVVSIVNGSGARLTDRAHLAEANAPRT